jgi:hypothetical protein
MKLLNILAYNLFMGEDEEQIKYIKENDFDILFLSETSNDIDKKLDNYISDKVESHCGYTYLGINKKIKIEILNIFKSAGIVIIHLKMNCNEMKTNEMKINELIICSIHLTPYKKNAKIRNIQIFKIHEILEDLNLLHLPIIIGGDTNMTDEEDDVIKEYNFIDAYNDNDYLTYPNREFMTNSKDSRITFVPKNDFRYDRFFIKNCECKEFKTIPNQHSDHLAINIIIKLIQ